MSRIRMLPYGGTLRYRALFELTPDPGFDVIDVFEEAVAAIHGVFVPYGVDAGEFAWSDRSYVSRNGSPMDVAAFVDGDGLVSWGMAVSADDPSFSWRVWELRVGLSQTSDGRLSTCVEVSSFDDPAHVPMRPLPFFPAPAVAVELVRLWSGRAMRGDGVLRERALYVGMDEAGIVRRSILSESREIPLLLAGELLADHIPVDWLARALCGTCCVCVIPADYASQFGVPPDGARAFFPACDDDDLSDPECSPSIAGSSLVDALPFLSRNLRMYAKTFGVGVACPEDVRAAKALATLREEGYDVCDIRAGCVHAAPRNPPRRL